MCIFHEWWSAPIYYFENFNHEEVVYVTIGNTTFSLALYLTGVHYRGELQHVGDVSEQKITC